MNVLKNLNEIDIERYIIVDYYIESQISLKDASYNLALGQSIGNPSIRNKWEDGNLFEEHSCKIISNGNLNSKYGFVKIAFPINNINLKEDGFTHLLTQIMGGQLDFDSILKCHIYNITFPNSITFNKPKYGIDGIRNYTKCYDKPLLGAIIKPKIGLSPNKMLDIVKELIDGGVNFIKEDEILSNPKCCRIEDRLPPILDYIKDRNVIYSVNITSDYPYVVDRAKLVYELGGNSVHINIWNGLGIYKSIRNLDLPLFLFFQKSGDRIITNPLHEFHINWDVICKLASYSGVDFIHAGMWGGYKNNEEDNLMYIMNLLKSNNVMPSLSCGMHPGLVNAITNRFGIDYMANCGGAIHGHPNGTKAGTMAMKQAIDKTYGNEYNIAIDKWGIVK